MNNYPKFAKLKIEIEKLQYKVTHIYTHGEKEYIFERKNNDNRNKNYFGNSKCINNSSSLS